MSKQDKKQKQSSSPSGPPSGRGVDYSLLSEKDPTETLARLYSLDEIGLAVVPVIQMVELDRPIEPLQRSGVVYYRVERSKGWNMEHAMAGSGISFFKDGKYICTVPYAKVNYFVES